jgi:predicted transcriptional regulator of viral defense system
MLRIVTDSVTIRNMGTGVVRAPELADWLLSRGIGSVSTGEVAGYLGVPPDQVRRRLHVPAGRGQWVSPAHGLWIPVPPEYRAWGAPPGIEIVDTLMRHMETDYYVGWLSAAELHGAAHQAPQVFQVATGRHIRNRQVGRTKFQFRTRTSLTGLPTTGFPTRSGSARISTPELTMLDVASDLDLAGGIDNAATVIAELADNEHFNPTALTRLSALFPAAPARRVGWVLDNVAALDGLDGLQETVVSRAATASVLDPFGPRRRTRRPAMAGAGEPGRRGGVLMIPLDAVTGWAVEHPWPTPVQVEQDLLLSRALCEIATDPYLGAELVFRGGTALHKLHLPRPYRYSEDLDYVRASGTGISEVTRALTALGERLGYTVGTRIGEHPKVYWRGSSAQGIPLRIKIEVNTHERSPALPHLRMGHRVASPWWTGHAEVLTFQPTELVATKIRALYQRSKGRDLFDLWLALQIAEIPPSDILGAFGPYRPNGLTAGVAIANLRAKLADRGFRADIDPLLVERPPDYDIDTAARLVTDVLLTRL